MKSVTKLDFGLLLFQMDFVYMNGNLILVNLLSYVV